MIQRYSYSLRYGNLAADNGEMVLYDDHAAAAVAGGRLV